MVMGAELISPNDRVASKLPGWVLAHDVHVVIAQGELHLRRCCPIADHCGAHTHGWRVDAVQL